MRINENLTIRSSGCLLVPYRREHVPQYHEWMKDPYLQQTTESEPLTMEQEYEMQASWRNDEDKCTFILLDTSPDLVEASKADPEGTLPLQQRTSLMAGDVNLYWNDPEDRSTVEIEVMVAEQRSRRKGIAKQALQCMMAFAVQRLGVQRFRWVCTRPRRRGRTHAHTRTRARTHTHTHTHTHPNICTCASRMACMEPQDLRTQAADDNAVPWLYLCLPAGRRFSMTTTHPWPCSLS